MVFVGHGSNKSTQLHLRYTLEKTAKGSKMSQNKARKLHDRREETADIVKLLRLRLQDTGGIFDEIKKFTGDFHSAIFLFRSHETD